MDRFKNVSVWIIAAALTVILGVGAVEPEQIADVERIQKAEAVEEQADIYNDEADFEFEIAAGDDYRICGGKVRCPYSPNIAGIAGYGYKG
ncbi:MAG: hypothetical protein LBU70_10115 [Chitinispirillales bacterium]|jgi:hypothetical protein|nr:hypothetical protein [Chitinispirillales bacterium]